MLYPLVVGALITMLPDSDFQTTDQILGFEGIAIVHT